ncbi:MAG: glycogen operon protein, partial [Bradymonadia bacterium]
GGAYGEERSYASVLSWRGLDNAEWYHTVDGLRYRNDNGVGPNLNYNSPLVRDLILDSLAYYKDVIGVDGFRFDLAAILGNNCVGDCFEFEAAGFLAEIAERFSRTEEGGVDLIAEPWGTTAGTYQVGNFPRGWHEWNDQFRTTIRGAINEPWEEPTPRQLAIRLHGSSDLFRDDGRGPDAGVGYVVSHDGFTWGDLFRCSDKDNLQGWPWGPSDGGSSQNQGDDYDGDEQLQRQAARTAFALMALSPSVPMLTGGDEFLRTQRCNNNPYNVDSQGNWLDWESAEDNQTFTTFVTRLLAFRAGEPTLTSGRWIEATDSDGDGLADITWYGSEAQPLTDAFLDDWTVRVLGWRLDADDDTTGSRSIYVAWNRSSEIQRLRLPATAPDTDWYRITDTAGWLEFESNSSESGTEPRMPGEFYDVHSGSVIVLVER